MKIELMLGKALYSSSPILRDPRHAKRSKDSAQDLTFVSSTFLVINTFSSINFLVDLES